MNRQKVRVGIVGAGGIARNIHLPCLAQLPDVSIQAICDLFPARAQEQAVRFHIPNVYGNYHDMLAETPLDAVFVLTQPDQLFRIAWDALGAGMDVFVEKPAGITLFQAEALARQAKARSAVLQVGLNRRYIPLLTEVLKKMRGTRINQVNAYFVKHADAAFYDGCASSYICDAIHAADTLQWIAGSRPVKAALVQGQYDSPVPNAWNAVIQYENGVTGTLQSNYQTGGRVHGVEIFGDTMSAYVNLGFGEARCEADLIHHVAPVFSQASSAKGGTRIEHIDGIALAGGPEYFRYYGYLCQDEAFISSVYTRKPPLSGIEQSIETMRMMDFLLANTL